MYLIYCRCQYKIVYVYYVHVHDQRYRLISVSLSSVFGFYYSLMYVAPSFIVDKLFAKVVLLILLRNIPSSLCLKSLCMYRAMMIYVVCF